MKEGRPDDGLSHLGARRDDGRLGTPDRHGQNAERAGGEDPGGLIDLATFFVLSTIALVAGIFGWLITFLVGLLLDQL